MSWRHDIRSATRLAVVQGLYQIEVSGLSCETVINQFLSHQKGAVGVNETSCMIDKELFSDMIVHVEGDRPLLDNHIVAVLSREWSMDRLGATMRALLRAACYELVTRSVVPARVVIKEYVDIAGEFHGPSETGFVNAALDRLARGLRSEEMKIGQPEGGSKVDAAAGQ